MVKIDRIVLTCEHGGNKIPASYAAYFARAKGVLATHRGYDIGALRLARQLARSLRVELQAATVSRLLIDLNRSPGHRSLFSEFMAKASREERDAIFRGFYLPYRKKVEAKVARHLRAGSKVLHLAIHSFTPVLNGTRRRADIGLLYDPRSEAEREFCHRWRRELGREAPWLCVRYNYPYRGRADGLGTYLRRRMGAKGCLAVELEVNQRHLSHPGATSAKVRRAIALSLRSALRGETPHER